MLFFFLSQFQCVLFFSNHMQFYYITPPLATSYAPPCPFKIASHRIVALISAEKASCSGAACCVDLRAVTVAAVEKDVHHHQKERRQDAHSELAEKFGSLRLVPSLLKELSSTEIVVMAVQAPQIRSPTGAPFRVYNCMLPNKTSCKSILMVVMLTCCNSITAPWSVEVFRP